jgi:rubredoxin
MTKHLRFCPNCGSINVEPDTTNSAEIAFTGGNPNHWRCNECDYTGMMPEGDPEEDFDEENTEDITFEPEENYQRVDMHFGRGYLKYLIYIGLPLFLAIFVLQNL